MTQFGHHFDIILYRTQCGHHFGSILHNFAIIWTLSKKDMTSVYCDITSFEFMLCTQGVWWRFNPSFCWGSWEFLVKSEFHVTYVHKCVLPATPLVCLCQNNVNIPRTRLINIYGKALSF